MKMNMARMDREGGQGGSALAIQISQAGWTGVIYVSISIYLPKPVRQSVQAAW